MSKGGNADYRLVFENNNVWIQKIGLDGFLVSLTPVMVEQSTAEPKTIFRPGPGGNSIVTFDRVGIVYKPARSLGHSHRLLRKPTREEKIRKMRRKYKDLCSHPNWL